MLRGDAGGWRLGLGVLHNRGIAGWLAAWDGLPDSAARPPDRPARPAPDGGEQLVAALAAMALSCLAARG